MKKFLLLIASALFALSLGVAHAADAPKAPEKVTNFGGKDPVMFDHAKHKEAKCEACHHNAKDGKFKCGECHGKEAKGKAISMKDAAHAKDKGVCYSCHFGEGKHKLSCNKCHKK